LLIKTESRIERADYSHVTCAAVWAYNDFEGDCPLYFGAHRIARVLGPLFMKNARARHIAFGAAPCVGTYNSTFSP